MAQKIASFTLKDDENLSATVSQFKRTNRECPHHDYGEKDHSTCFYDGLNDSTKALLDSVLGGQLSKIPCNQVKAKIEKVEKNRSYGRVRGSGLPWGMIDASKIGTIGAKIEAIMDKKLSKLKLAQGSSNVSSTNEKFFSCKICDDINHDTSYCGGSNSEHVAAVNYGGGRGAIKKGLRS